MLQLHLNAFVLLVLNLFKLRQLFLFMLPRETDLCQSLYGVNIRQTILERKENTKSTFNRKHPSCTGWTIDVTYIYRVNIGIGRHILPAVFVLLMCSRAHSRLHLIALLNFAQRLRNEPLLMFCDAFHVRVCDLNKHNATCMDNFIYLLLITNVG